MTRNALLSKIGNLLEELELVQGSYGLKADSILLLIEKELPDFEDFYDNFKE